LKSEPQKKDTPTQFLMASWVKEAGFGSILEQDFEPYVVDIYIPDLMLALEIDGPYHMTRRDEYRDAHIRTNYNIEIWRYPLKIVKSSFKAEFVDNLLKYAQEQINA
jgi:very-short-patch-repair endonuclease